jgi:hypothetical protein
LEAEPFMGKKKKKCCGSGKCKNCPLGLGKMKNLGKDDKKMDKKKSAEKKPAPKKDVAKKDVKKDAKKK